MTSPLAKCTPVRFMYNNFVCESSLTTTSEDPSFPVANLFCASRSRVMKTAGHFEITSANNTVYINDGADKSDTLASGSYTGDELALAIYDLVVGLAGGGGSVGYTDRRFSFSFFPSLTLRFSQQTNAVWKTMGFETTTDLVAGPFIADLQVNHNVERWVVDCLIPQELSFFAAIGPLDEAFGISGVGTSKVKANNVELWDSPPFEVDLTLDDRGLMAFLDSETGFGAYRYWALEIRDPYNAAGPDAIKIGSLYFGDHQTFQNTNIGRGFTLSKQDNSSVQTSVSGVRFFDEKIKYEQMANFTVQNADCEDREMFQQVFCDQGNTRPFYISLDPQLCFTKKLPDFTKYVTFTASPTLPHVFLEYHDISFSVREDI